MKGIGLVRIWVKTCAKEVALTGRRLTVHERAYLTWRCGGPAERAGERARRQTTTTTTTTRTTSLDDDLGREGAWPCERRARRADDDGAGHFEERQREARPFCHFWACGGRSRY